MEGDLTEEQKMARIIADLMVKYLIPECQAVGREIGERCTPDAIAFLAWLVSRGLPMRDARDSIRKIVRR